MSRDISVPPLLKTIKLPPLIGMIALGFIARNYLGPMMDSFPNKWGSYIRSSALSFLLVRGGMQVTFQG